MASRIHFFKLLEECHNDLFIKIPETIIFGFGFENVTYVHNTETGTLIFKTITFASLHGITNHWILKNGISKLIIKTREGNKIIESNEGIMDYVTVECIIQEFLEQDQLFSNNKVS